MKQEQTELWMSDEEYNALWVYWTCSDGVYVRRSLDTIE